MSQAELLTRVVTVLQRQGVAHMLTGSHASGCYGDPRMTHDIDLVVDMLRRQAREFAGPNY